GVAYLDYFEIEYSRYLNTSSNSIHFISPLSNGLAQYQLNGPTSPWIFDITDFANVKAVQAAMFKDSTSANLARRYLAIATTALLSPTSIVKDVRAGDEYTNLRTPIGADLLCIVNDAFYEAMEAYEVYRESDPALPLEVLRVRTSDIFDEYGWGLVDPAAIRDFLKATLPENGWDPSPYFVLFVGDGDFDYKNKLSTGDNNWVIPYVNSNVCTDDWYSYFSIGQEYPQVASGRWTVQSVAEVETMIERLIAYESGSELGPWRNRVVFAADDEYGEGGAYASWEKIHTEKTELIAENFVPSFLNVVKIYETEYPESWDPAGGGKSKLGATADLIAAINDGCLLVNYMGHGNPTVWSHEHLFLQSRDFSKIQNGSKMPLFLAATCDWAYWDSPFDQSMPEEMLLIPNGGAVACLAATRETGASPNVSLVQNFFTELFSQPGGERLGEALMRAKFSSSNFFLVHGGDSNNHEKYHLLADPFMKLALPQHEVIIDSSSVDTLDALNKITVSGQLQSQSGIPIPDFQGVALLQVFNTRVPVYYGFNNSSPPPFPTYILPGNLIFRGDCSVQNGVFQGTFVVPIDVNYGGSDGRFSVYSYSDNSDAVGVYEEVCFGEAISALQDSIPPAVTVYFDSPNFRSGDAVGAEAILYVEVADSNGVNLTGSPGHGITVSIDGQTPLDLTSAFSYYLDSYTTGRAEYQLSAGELAPGPHAAQAFAWDAANNPNLAEVGFEVVSEEELRIFDVLNYPNPFSTTTRFTFCLTVAAEVTIKIYTVAGRLVKVIKSISGQTQFNASDPLLVWDGRDSQGDLLSNGVYLYKVIAQGYNGTKAEEIGKLMFLR
ncbi:MAG: type IX secretion system sortase PorU, partial [bacterium]